MIPSTKRTTEMYLVVAGKIKHISFKLLLCAICILTMFTKATAGNNDGGIEERQSAKPLTGTVATINSFALDLNQATYIDYTSFPVQTTQQNKKIKNIITFSINEETANYISQDFTASVTLLIEYGHSAGSLNSLTQTFTVDYKKAEGAKYNAKQYFYLDDAEYVRITVQAITTPTLGSLNTKDILLLENEMLITRYFELPNTVPAPTLLTHSTLLVPVPDHLTVNWTWPVNTGNNATQIEWSWIENELSANYEVNGSPSYALIFKNSTRVDLPYNKVNYDIPLLYEGVGKLYYRIRAVNIKASGTRSDGPWNVGNAYSFVGHNNDLNWLAVINFAEEGKSKTVIKYFDGSMRDRQTVTKDNTTNSILTSESFYDGEGRPAIQILPTPGITNIIKYQANLNLFNGQSAGQDPAELFDMELIATPGSFTPSLSTATVSGSSKYYSSSNPEINDKANKNIPDAEGYPYTVTRYTPDGTGRLMIESEVGSAHKMGSGHETKYYYGTPSQEELDGLFGTEVGNFTHYSKNMLKDANGQMGISYVDMHGRTIATALAGNAPGNLQALGINNTTLYPGQSGSNITRNLLDNNSNVVKENTIESINSLLVPATTNYTFRYELNPQILQVAACNGANPATLCYDCLYDLEITITDESGDAVPIVRKFSNVSLNPDDNCSTNIPAFKNLATNNISNIITFTESLLPGSYSIRKTLSISESSFQYYKELYMSKAVCKTEQQIIDSVYNVLLATSNCADTTPVTCQSCSTALGTEPQFRTNYLASIAPVQSTPQIENEIHAAYITAQQNCNRLCNTVSQSLPTIREMMLLDMVPYSGQYAQEDATNNTTLGVHTMYDKYNIFSTVYPATQPFYKYPWTSSKALDFYHDGTNNIDISIHPEQAPAPSYTLLNSTTQAGFEQLFKTSWAEALLPHHPEYDRLLFAENNLTNSYNWINQFTQADYATALTNGYLNPVTNDPFFVQAPGYSGTMNNAIANYQGMGVGMWQLAYGDVSCKNIMDATARKNCYLAAPNTAPPYSGFSAAQNEQVWNIFRGLYAAERSNYVNEYIANGSPALTTDENDLMTQNFRLWFPRNNQQLATGNQWSWWPSAQGGGPVGGTGGGTTTAYNDRCSSYISRWTAQLLQCTALQNDPNKNAIISAITTRMQAVCVNGSNEANPYGSSTVAPATPASITDRSFEDVIKNVFIQYGIINANGIYTDNYCNPFVIEWPKPYGKGPKMVGGETIGQIDSCNCRQYGIITSQAAGQGVNISNLTQLNQYLLTNYGEQLTPELFAALQHCNELTHINCVTRDTTLSYTCGQQPPVCPGIINPRKSLTPEQKADNNFAKGPPTCAQIAPMVSLFHQNYGYPTGDQCQSLFVSFFNSYFSTSFTWAQIVTLYSSCGTDLVVCAPAPICYVICSITRCDTTYSPYILTQPQPVPDFLKCGYINNPRCISCAVLSDYTAEYKAKFTAQVNTAPLFTGSNLTPAQVQYNMNYARFINFKTGFQYNWIDYSQAAVNATPSCNLDNYNNNGSALQNVICGSARPLADTISIPKDAPCVKVYTMAITLGQEIYLKRQQYLLQGFEEAYKTRCLDAKDIEQFTVNYITSEYHYTLYYYDMAGNLVKTVPPKGVRPDFSAAYVAQVEADKVNNVINTRPHELVTQYRYNSLNQVIAQNSPDGGTSLSWYDKLGRLVIYQNAQQAVDNNYGYTLYDALGRITEVGQKPQSANSMNQSISQDVAALDNWLNATGGIKNQITRTTYDIIASNVNPLPLTQLNLRNRVSYVQLFDTDPGAATSFDHQNARYYTYDIHGNVDELLNDYKAIAAMSNNGQRFKLMTYDYDLISGKVNQVSYQPGLDDAFYHKYKYDLENRISEVYTSRDKIIWEKEVAYGYYKHGPLARMELGQLKVQGTDYAYTLQGWLKGVNNTGLNSAVDITGDGTGQDKAAKDALSYALHYYDETAGGNNYIDYKSIGAVSAFVRPGIGNVVSLYNGNIGGMSVNNAGLLKANAGNNNTMALLHSYRYDQLNRIVNMQAYKGLDAVNNQWNAIAINDYQEAISYDPNGNILSYNRKGAPTAGMPLEMDDLSYNYLPNTNQLKQVRDAVGAGNYTEDIDDQPNSNNYTYDKIGNLKTDIAGGITNINWNLYGKIESITKATGTISYTYDVDGKRISKTINGVTTIYIRDAAGVTMALYQSNNNAAPEVKENNLIGSSRIGIVTKLTVQTQVISIAQGFGTAKISTFTRGEKIYELSNHLGNVLLTITDKKIQHTTDNSTVDYYTAEIVTANDYYPFGMQMPGRKYSIAGKYRYGFNGKEKDDEINGEGNTYDFGERIYDSRIGRFFSVDPLEEDYEDISPYAFASNNPIFFVDENGEWPKPSQILARFGIHLSPFASGFLDGLVSKLSWWDTLSFIDDLIENEDGFRTKVWQGLKAIVSDPVGTVKQIVADKFNAYSAVFSGNATNEQAYSVGDDIGGLAGGLLSGGTIITVLRTLEKNAAKRIEKAIIKAPVAPVIQQKVVQVVQAAKKKITGNSYLSNKPQHGYRIIDTKTGDVHKYGVSGGKLNKNGTSPRANRQVSELNKKAGSNRYVAEVVKKDVKGTATKTARQRILEWEWGKTKSYNLSKGKNPKGNDLPIVEGYPRCPLFY